MNVANDISISIHTDDEQGFPAEEEEPLEIDLSPWPVKVGIITGTGLEEVDMLDKPVQIQCCTPFGKASETLTSGYIEEVPCIQIKRHGLEHNIMPSNINYRANIWALRKLRCTHLLVTHGCGSLKDCMRVGDFVIPHDFIDITSKRSQTFYDGCAGSPYGVCHCPMVPVFHERIRNFLIEAAKDTGFKVHERALIAINEGPRFATRSENKLYRSWGCDLTNMTLSPEIILAKEAGLLCGCIALVSNQESKDVGMPSPNVRDIVQTMFDNKLKLTKIIKETIHEINNLDWTEEVYNAKVTVCRNFITRE